MSEETKKDTQDPTSPAPTAPNETAGDQPDTLSMTRRELISTVPKVALGVGLGLAAAEQQGNAFNGAAMFFKGSRPSPIYGLWTFGRNSYGQLGLGDMNNRSSPVQVGSLSNWVTMAQGRIHCIALRADGTLWTFGSNSYGLLGLGDMIPRSSPVQVGSLGYWSEVAAGIEHSLARRIDGTLWTFGRNNEGQLGLGDFTARSSPVQVGTLSNWKSAKGGVNHGLALRDES